MLKPTSRGMIVDTGAIIFNCPRLCKTCQAVSFLYVIFGNIQYEGINRTYFQWEEG